MGPSTDNLVLKEPRSMLSGLPNLPTNLQPTTYVEPPVCFRTSSAPWAQFQLEMKMQMETQT